MRYLFIILLSFSTNLIYSGELEYLEPKVSSLENPSPERILFVGNSYLYYNDSLHNHLRRMFEEKKPHTGRKVRI